MKNLVLTFAIAIFISTFITSCNKCGLCNNPAVDLDVDAAKVCRSGNKAAYNAAIAECENRGGSWYWNEEK